MTTQDGSIGRQTAIGAFVVGGTLLLVGVVVLFGKFTFFSPTVRASIVFQDSSSGLSVGAPVTFRGVRVGAVDGIAVAFDPKTQMAYIPVTLRLEPTKVVLTNVEGSNAIDLPKLISEGLRAELNMQSFVTGQSEIDLDFDPASVAVLHPGISLLEEIPTRPSTMQRVKEQLSQLPLREVADNANATLQSLRSLSEKLNLSLPPLIDSLKTTSDRSADMIGTGSRAIAELQIKIEGMLENINRVAKTGDAVLIQRGAELRTVLTSSNQTIVQARDLLSDLKGLTSERGADRANIDSALRDLATAAAALRGLANDVEHNPQLLLTGRRP